MKSKNKVQIVNWLLTRMCNLHCDYCGIVRYPCFDFQTLTKDRYPDLYHYLKNGMSYEYVINCLKQFKEFDKNCFHIFYGGEPFLYRDLKKIIKFCNDNYIYYTVITNNTEKIRKIMYEDLKYVKYYQGISSSVDPIIYTDDDKIKKSDRYAKSIAGLENLKKIKYDGISNDVVAEITIDKYNIDYAYKLVEELSNNGIYSSITFIDLKKNPYYDFSNVTDDSYIIEPTNENYVKLQNLIDAGFLIHMGEELLDRTFNILPHNLDCQLEEYNHNLTIDADGSIRLCLRIKGINSSKYKAIDYFENFDEIHKAMIEDKQKYCQGCCWTCPIMSKLAIEEDMHNEILHK